MIITPDGSGKLPVGLPVVVQGIAFSGDGPVTKVEVSADDGKTWALASLGEDHGPYSFRTWQYTWTPRAPGKYLLAVRATDAKGHNPPWPAPAQDAKTPRNIAPRADEGHEKSLILDRGRACLTPRRFRRTFPFEGKGPLKILCLH